MPQQLTDWNKFNLTWEFHRTSYTEFADDVDLEKLSHLSKKLVELQRSDAPFKDSVIDFIDLLKRGFGNINASHHNNTLSIDLGYSKLSASALNASICQLKETQ